MQMKYLSLQHNFLYVVRVILNNITILQQTKLVQKLDNIVL